MDELRLEMQKKARIMAIVFEVLKVTMIVALCIILISMAVLTFLPADMKIGNASLHSGISLNGRLIDSVGEMVQEMPTLFYYVSNAAILLVIFFIAVKLFKSISAEKSPFTLANVKRLQNIGTALMVSALLPGIVRGITALALGQEMSDILDMMPLVIGLLLWLLGSIFTYGVRLQQENDETI